jgi:hypothetical protein
MNTIQPHIEEITGQKLSSLNFFHFVFVDISRLHRFGRVGN